MATAKRLPMSYAYEVKLDERNPELYDLFRTSLLTYNFTEYSQIADRLNVHPEIIEACLAKAVEQGDLEEGEVERIFHDSDVRLDAKHTFDYELAS